MMCIPSCDGCPRCTPGCDGDPKDCRKCPEREAVMEIVLNDADWDAFVLKLEEPPRVLPRLRALMDGPTVTS